MKPLSKTLIVTVFFSMALAFCAYAEEVKTTEAVDAVSVEMPMPAPAPAMNTEKVPIAPEVSGVAAPVVQAVVPPVLVPAEKTTLENLQAAFNGESNANAKYLAFAKKADEEGYGKVASLFRAAARAEQVHFGHHAGIIKKMGAVPTAVIEAPEVKTTAENLQAAIDGETYETTTMYPEFLAKAQLDKNEAAIDAFKDAGKAEAVHAALYTKALASLPAWKGKKAEFYVCPVCGNVVEKLGFQSCPICGESKRKFLSVK